MTRETSSEVGNDTTHRAENIDRITVPVRDIEVALRNNAQPARGATDVLRINPDLKLNDFPEHAEAKRFTSQRGNRYPPEISVVPVHIPPKAFIKPNSPLAHYPNIGEVRARCMDETGLEPGDDEWENEVEEWINVALEVWHGELRASLCDEIDIVTAESRHQPGKHIVSVVYTDGDR